MSSPVAIGSTIAGKYRVERVLGQGGMGVVVVAMHDELDQRVAIKFLLKDALSDSEWIARFSREAKAAARIKSEHAVKVYDVGKLDTGAPYMVMEYLEGRDLQTILNDQKTLPVLEAVEYVLQACEAIAEAHGAGVVHRDLKPANLFVTHRTDGSSCVKILDFGISKMSSLTGGDQQTVTNTSAIVGSPLYMSPEQMRASKNVDRRTDIWSLGVILQELVSGMPSFVANTTAELCALVLTAPPSPLDMPNTPATKGLGAVITKCLEKKPEDRYATVADLARALEPFGPPSVKTSVERIGRLAQSGSRQAPVSKAEQSGPVSIVPLGQSPNVSSLGQTEMSEAMEAPTEPVAVRAPAMPGSGTAATWSSQPSTRRSRTPLIAGGAALAALAVLAIVFFAIRGSQTSPATSDGVSQPKATTTLTAAGGGSTVIVPSATQTATSTATTTVATTTATAATTTTNQVTTSATHVKPVTSSSGKKPPVVAPVDTTGFGGRN